MTVEQFVERHRDDWRRLEALCDIILRRGPAALSAGELSDFGRLHRSASGDLAYARAHLPRLELVAWLNRLVSRAHGALYARERAGAGGIRRFYQTYPARWRAAWPFLLAAAAVLGGAIAVAWLAVLGDPARASLFVPPLLLEAVGPGSAGAAPTAYVALSGFILTNNLTAALICFATGLLGGVGTVLSLLQNGLLLGGLAGAAQSASPEVLRDFLALVLPHGVLELAALLTCAAGGLRLGWALIHGGPRPRLEALGAAGREGVALVAGAAPWFVAAALIEGFVTPAPLPVAAKLALGGALTTMLAAYLRGGLEVPDGAR